jgi:hypothetical protein
MASDPSNVNGLSSFWLDRFVCDVGVSPVHRENHGWDANFFCSECPERADLFVAELNPHTNHQLEMRKEKAK